MLGEVGVAGLVEGIGERPGQADALVELADGQQPGVTEELTWRRLNHERGADEFEDMWPAGWYIH